VEFPIHFCLVYIENYLRFATIDPKTKNIMLRIRIYKIAILIRQQKKNNFCLGWSKLVVHRAMRSDQRCVIVDHELEIIKMICSVQEP
jgi:hypothetical protein